MRRESHPVKQDERWKLTFERYGSFNQCCRGFIKDLCSKANLSNRKVYKNTIFSRLSNQVDKMVLIVRQFAGYTVLNVVASVILCAAPQCICHVV